MAEWTFRPPLRAAASLIAVCVVASVLVAGPAPAAPPAEGTWARTNARTGPSARDRMTMAYDAARAEIVLFGGISRHGKQDGTWVRRAASWTRLDPTVSPPLRTGGAMAYDAVREEIVLFGGHTDAGRVADTWVWDGERWQERISETSPPARSFAAMTYDTAREEIVLFGGLGAAGGSRADTWTWDGTTWTQEEPATSPPLRDSAAMTYDAARQEVVLYGGFGQGGPRNDTWTWDGTDWRQESPTVSPPARNSAGMAYDAAREETVLFGGIDRSRHRNDTWTWDGTTWIDQAASAPPTPRSSMGFTYDAGIERAVMFGGSSANLTREDTWLWDGTAWASADPAIPEARHSAVFERDATGRLILFGGAIDQGLSADTWAWDGAWRALEPALSPSARSNASIAYDAEREELVVFGGLGAGAEELGDTWVWDGTTWTRRPTTIAPPPRHNAVMTYDSHRNEVVLFGGSNRDLGVVFDDTWTWDGTEWTLETPESSPPARSAAAFAFDPATRRAVLFGGYDAKVNRTDTTWLWNGQNWFESFFGERPPPRAAAGMTYNGALGIIFMFGGNAGLGEHLSDTWKWTGEEWKAVTTDGAPEGRFAPGLAYHESTRSTVVFGGNANVFLDDTWTWRSSTPVPAVDPAALWTRYGAGWLRDFELADLDGGGNELIVGGFGVGALDQRSLANGRYRWMNKWPDQPDPAQGDDKELAYDIATDDVTGDGVPDTLAGTSMGVMAFDGRDGRELYRVPNDGGFNDVWEIAAADFNDDGIDDVVYTFLSEAPVYAADGRDGSLLWRAERTAAFTTQIGTTDLNDDGATDVLVIGSGGIGSNINAYSGAQAAATGVATPLWSRAFPGGDPAVFRIGQIIAGGPKEIVVGGYLGEVEVMNATTGATLAAWEVERNTDIELVQMDDDADLEIAIATGFNDDNGESTTVHAFDPLGQPLWTYDAAMPPNALDALDLDGDGSDELVVGGGFYEFRGREGKDGFVAGLDPHVDELENGAPSERWRTTTPTRVGMVGHGSILGQPTILVGEDVDAYVRGLSYDGGERFVYRLGGQPRDVSAVDIDGDGRPEIVEGATDAEISVHDRRGNTLWHARVPGKATPDVETVHAGRLTDDPGLEIIAGTFEFGRGEGGYVRVFTSDGRPLWSDRTAGSVGTVLAADLDHDDTDEVLVANTGVGLGGSGAQIARYAGDGTALWKSPTPPSIFGPYVGTARVNDDGIDDVIVLTLPFGRSFVLAYDGATGAELWRFDPESVGQWLDVRDEPAGGITFGDMRGQIFRLDVATGEPVWETEVDLPSRDGAWTIDANGDGVLDVVTSGDSGIVHLLSGADGTELWSRALDRDERGFRVATISGATGAHVAVGSYTNSNGQRSGVYFFDPVDGTRVGRFETEAHVHDIEAVDVNGDGNEEALTAAGLQIHAIDIHGSEPEPEPTATASPLPTPTASSTPTTSPSSSPPSGGGEDRYTAEGRITAFNPTSNRVTGVTETEFNARCSIPASQGFDGFVFALPERFGDGNAFATVAGANAFGLYDLDAYFYSADCDELAPAASSPARDEAGRVPRGSRFIVVNALLGIDTTVRLEVTTAADNTDATPSPTPTDAGPGQGSTSTPTDPPSSPGGGTTPGGASSGPPSSNGSQGPGGDPSGDGTSSQSPSAASVRGDATVTIGSDRSVVRLRRPVSLSGSASGVGTCDPQTVEILRRRHGARRFATAGEAVLSEDGSWSFTLRPRRNASYAARVPSSRACEPASSTPVDVLVRAKIALAAHKDRCRSPQRVRGRLIPVHRRGRVVLQRKVGARWKRVDSDALDRRSRFVVTARRCGARYRVLWPGSTSNARTSKLLLIEGSR